MDSKLGLMVLLVLQLFFTSFAMVASAQDTKTSTDWKSLRFVDGKFDLVELALVQRDIPSDPRHPHFDQKLIGKRIAPLFIELKYPIDKELRISEPQRQELISLYRELPTIDRSLREEFFTKDYEKKRKIARDKLETADNRSKASREVVKTLPC